MDNATTAQALVRSHCLLLNASYEVLEYIDTPRAITMLVNEQVNVVQAEEDRFVHSRHLTLPWPTIVALRKYVLVPHDIRQDPEVATHSDILKRDKWTCAYCGKFGDTIDHVIPQSRGGLDRWDNLVVACKLCNNTKADRTPEEAGMKLLFPPRKPSSRSKAQEMVWALVAEQVAV